MRTKLPFLAVLITVLLCTGSALALFGPPTQVFKGRVNFIQPTNFTLLADNNQMVRVIVPANRELPVEVQLGVKVEVKAVQGHDGLWYLDKFKKIELQPGLSSRG